MWQLHWSAGAVAPFSEMADYDLTNVRTRRIMKTET